MAEHSHIPLEAEADSCFLRALEQTVLALQLMQLDHIPCQGTLIALLRYGTFPCGRLSENKTDVVDNDSEFMIFLEPDADVPSVSRNISLFLEADGWAPCYMQTDGKLVCMSLHLEVPMKVEMYFFRKNLEEKVITFNGEDQVLQAWGGRLPLEIVYPFSQCRLGSA